VNAPRTTRPAAHAGFTLVEVLFAIAVIGILIGLLVVGLTVGRRVAAGNAGEATVASLKMSASEFVREFGFVPPLIKDYDLSKAQTGERRFPVYVASPLTGADARMLRAEDVVSTDPDGNGKPAGWGSADEYWDLRYSYATLPVYLVGVDETPLFSGAAVPMDGAPGPGMLRPNEDGSFQIPENSKKAGAAVKRVGQTFGPFMDTGRSSAKVARAGTKGERLELRDTKGIPIRYYRWLQGNPSSSPKYKVEKPADMNVPKVVGDPEKDPALRSASAAIVWCGADGLYGDEPKGTIADKLGVPVNSVELERKAREQATSDNKVEVIGT